MSPRIPCLTLCVALACPPIAKAFFFAGPRPAPLYQRVQQSKVILYGGLQNARKTPDGGITDLLITEILVGPMALQGRKMVQIPRYLSDPRPKNAQHWIVFADVVDGELDFSSGIVAGPAIRDYVKGLLRITDDSHVSVLRYCLAYLDHPDEAVRTEAHNVFLSATNEEIGSAAGEANPAKLRRWLRDPRTGRELWGLYALMLGHCGNAQDGPVFRALLRKETVRPIDWRHIEGTLIGYTLVDRKKGWATIREQFEHPGQDYERRWAALRAVRFLHDSRPGLISEKEILAVLRLAVAQGDVADFAINDLRAWRCWDFTESILSHFCRESHHYPGVRRAILCYALTCPQPRAAQFIAEQRSQHPDWVQDAEDMLEE